MNRNEIAVPFILAAVYKATGEMDRVDSYFLETIATGVPEDVKVLYLFADRTVHPTSIEDAKHFDVFVLELEG